MISKVQKATEVRNILCRVQAFVGDAQPDSGVAFEQIESDAPPNGKVLRGIAAPDAAIVFALRHVEHPVHAVFDAPVRPYRFTSNIAFADGLLMSKRRSLLQAKLPLSWRISRVDSTMLFKPVQRWPCADNQLTSLVNTQRRAWNLNVYFVFQNMLSLLGFFGGNSDDDVIVTI